MLKPKQLSVEDISLVLQRLVGPIFPVGEAHTDSKNFKNLVKLSKILEAQINLLKELVLNNRRANEASRKQAYNTAIESMDRASCHWEEFKNDYNLVRKN